MTETLPPFTYHPNPLATGSVEPSDTVCVCCHRARGFVYVGPTYAREDIDEALCPWCIADGSAAATFDAHFTDLPVDVPADVPAEVIETVLRRTPSYSAWQQDHWMFHCRDGAEFLGVVGRRELEPYPDALEMLRHENDEFGWPEEQVEAYLASLERVGQPSAYLFRCRHCGTHLAYSDFT